MLLFFFFYTFLFSGPDFKGQKINDHDIDVMNVKRSEGWEFRAEPFHFIFTCFLRCGVKFISLSFYTSVLHLSNFVSAVIFPTLLLSLE